MKMLAPGAALALALTAFVACEAPSVRVPVKRDAIQDADDADEEAEEATYRKSCRTSADCPGAENDVCSPELGCVECTSDTHCDADETCIVAWGDCENIERRP